MNKKKSKKTHIKKWITLIMMLFIIQNAQIVKADEQYSYSNKTIRITDTYIEINGQSFNDAKIIYMTENSNSWTTLNMTQQPVPSITVYTYNYKEKIKENFKFRIQYYDTTTKTTKYTDEYYYPYNWTITTETPTTEKQTTEKPTETITESQTTQEELPSTNILGESEEYKITYRCTGKDSIELQFAIKSKHDSSKNGLFQYIRDTNETPEGLYLPIQNGVATGSINNLKNGEEISIVFYYYDEIGVLRTTDTIFYTHKIEREENTENFISFEYKENLPTDIDEVTQYAITQKIYNLILMMFWFNILKWLLDTTTKALNKAYNKGL